MVCIDKQECIMVCALETSHGKWLVLYAMLNLLMDCHFITQSQTSLGGFLAHPSFLGIE